MAVSCPALAADTAWALRGRGGVTLAVAAVVQNGGGPVAGPRTGARSARETRRVSDLIDTTEMYLKTIYELEEVGIVALRARIAERLHQSGPTVSQTVARMERDGLLTVEGDRHLELSPLGQTRAM